MAEEESDDEQIFEDAQESIVMPQEIDLPTGIQETSVTLNLFLNNKFHEAKARMEPWANRSMYHALGYGTIMYLQAAMTFDMGDIKDAIAATKQGLNVCNKQRKRLPLLSFGKTNYDSYTEEEIHAELCYAECLLERALLSFIQDENFISFVKGGLKIRDCYHSYKECLKILRQRSWKDSKRKHHFESGVQMGIGAFNLFISLLPARILKLLEFVGFSGNKSVGLRELEKGSQNTNSLRGPLCSLILLGYHTLVTYVLGTADGDISLAEEVITPCLREYPKSGLFLFFAGRIEEIKGNLDEAIDRLEESLEAQSEWKHIHQICYWELMWCHCFKCDWLIAMKYAERLCRESKWSKATYTYQKACFLMMCEDQTEETHAHIDYLYGEVPKLVQRIAGKSIPIEKFALRKVTRYAEQGNRLTLPALELIYVWNGFSIIGKKLPLLEPMITIIEAAIVDILNHKDDYKYFTDDYSLALLLKGVCMQHWGKTFQAGQCFQEVIDISKNLKHDLYLAPWATVELGLLHLEQGDYTKATKLLEHAKSNYKRYSLESRLHFKIKAGQLKIKQIMNPSQTSLAAAEDAIMSQESPTMNGKAMVASNSKNELKECESVFEDASDETPIPTPAPSNSLKLETKL